METLNKQGYIQTELGLIPENWEIKSVGEIGSFKKGKGIKKDEVLPDGIPCVRYGELYTIYNDIIRTTNSFIDGSVALTSHKLKFGDILFAGSGETKEDIGKSAAFLGEVETYAGGDIVILTPREIDSAYLGYLLNLSIISKQKSQQGQGDAVVHIYPNGLSKIKVPLPPKKEQTAIATALSDIDSYISSLEALIAKKRLIKLGAMQELLTPKEDWGVKKLGEVVKKFRLGGNYPNSEANSGFPLIKMGNLHRGEISVSKLEYINHNIAPNLSDKLVCGDFLFNTRNTLDLVGKVAIWRNELPEAFYNSNIMKIDFDKLHVGSNFFMNYLFNMPYLISQLKDLATGTTSVAAIYTRDLMEMKISLPNRSHQIKTANIINELHQEISFLGEKLEKAKVIKQGMMLDLLTGRVRLV
jgi:type I restriction enzyme, S subunit